MDYEIMMNGNVKIGTYAPDFEANSTMGPITLINIKENGLYFFLIQEILPPYEHTIWGNIRNA